MERRSGRDRRKLTGAQKAAALLLTMGRETASRLLKHLDPADIRDITRAAATLGLVDRLAVGMLIEEFETGIKEGPNLVGDVAEAEQLVSNALAPEALSDILAELNGVKKVDIWSELAKAAENRIIQIITPESPQITALILSRVEPDLVARICAMLDPSDRNVILARMLASRPVTPPILNVLEENMREALATPVIESQEGKAPARIANIVNRMEPAEIDKVLDGLAEIQPAKVESVRALIFKFEDVGALSLAARSALFDQVPTERVVLALKGADTGLQASVLAALGARARRMVEAELSSGEPGPPREVTAARRFIADAALRLAESGVIELPAAATPSAAA